MLDPTDHSLIIVTAALTKMNPVRPEDVPQLHALRSSTVYLLQNGAVRSVLTTLSQHHHDHYHEQGWNRTHHLRMYVFDKHEKPHDD